MPPNQSIPHSIPNTNKGDTGSDVQAHLCSGHQALHRMFTNHSDPQIEVSKWLSKFMVAHLVLWLTAVAATVAALMCRMNLGVQGVCSPAKVAELMQILQSSPEGGC